MKQAPREALFPRIIRAAHHRPQCPQRAPVAVLGAVFLEPLTGVRHEIPESPSALVERVVHECQVACGEGAYPPRVLRPRLLHERHQEKRSRVVVETIAIVIAGYAEGRVLEDAGPVAHQVDVLEVDLGELRGPRGECLRLEDRTEPVRMLRTCALEALDVAMRDRWPHHLS